MLTEREIKEIRGHLEKAQNPIFFFDNDPDGLCSFLLLQRYIGRGKGIPVKTFPSLDADYFRKINELNADYVFILDKPVVSIEFFKEIEQVNIPVVWIDHHKIDKNEIPKFVNYYNPMDNSDRNEPTSYLCYQVSQKKEDLWISVAGCISDKFIPEFYSQFKEIYPDLSINSKDAFEIFYDSEIGKIARIFSFGLKDRTINVVNMLKFLINAKTPYEVLEESNKNYSMHYRFRQIYKKYKKFLDKATEVGKKSGRVLFFQYGGDLSISSDLSNQLIHHFPDKTVIVVYVTGIKANISVRGKNVRGIILKAIEGINGATGGGHEDAVGAQLKISELEKFKEKLFNLIDNH